MEKALASVKGLRKYFFREEIFPNEFVEDGLIIRPDGNISVGFTVAFPSSEEIDETEILSIESTLEKVFSRLPEGTVVHFQTQYFNTPDSIKAYEESLSGFLVGTMINHLRDRAVMKSKTVLYICFNLRKIKQRSAINTLFASYATWKNPLQNLPKDKALIKGHIQTFTAQFSNVPRIKIQQLTDIGLRNELIRYNNLDFSAQKPNEVVYDNDHANLHNKYIVGDKYVGFCYLGKSANPIFRSSRNDRGVNTFMGWPMGFALDFPHVVNLSFRIEGEQLLKRLDIIKNIRKSMGKNTREIDVLANEDLTAFTQEMRGEGKVPVRMSHNVMVWSTHPDELSYRLDLTKASYIQMNGSTGMVPAMNTGNFFHANMPGYALDLFHTLVMSLEDAILHFDYSKETISDQRGTLLCTRAHEPVLVDFWSNALANKNKLCIGPSGSGKSFTWNTIISQAIEAGDEITLLDVGGSYKNLFTQYQDSKYIETNAEAGLTFNPFLIPKNERDEFVLNEDKMTFLLTLISLLWKRVDKGEALSKEEESIFADWLKLFYKEINQTKDKTPKFEKFVTFVEKMAQSPSAAPSRFIDMESFSLVMKKFIANGTYSNVLNSDDNINISDRKLICFDLFGVQKDPILYPVVAMIIVELVLDKIRKNPTRRKQIVIDEAWSMLSGSMGDFIETVFRTCRKHYASITIISQGIIELKQSKVGEAIKANAATRIILDHNSQPALIADVKNFFSLTDHEEELLKSIRNGGTWREVFIQRGNVSQVFIVDVGPHAKAAFSSESKDRAEINELTRKVNPEYAIKQFVENSIQHD